MKKFILSLAVACFPFLGHCLQIDSLGYAGPFTVNLTVLQQVESDALVKSTTNHTAISTNISLLYKWTQKKFIFNNASLLKLLANSYNTNFPAGVRLASDGTSLFVTDKTGTNVVLDIGSVVAVNSIQAVVTATEPQVESTVKGKSTEKYSGIYNQTTYANISYNDSALTTADGTHSVFTITGIFKGTQNINYITGHASQNFQISDGAGYGTIRGVSSVVMGTSTGKSTGVELAF